MSYIHAGSTAFSESQHLLPSLFKLLCISLSSNISSLWSSATGLLPAVWLTGTKFQENQLIPTSWQTITLVYVYHVTHYHNPEDHNLTIQCCENLKYHVTCTLFSSAISWNYTATHNWMTQYSIWLRKVKKLWNYWGQQVAVLYGWAGTLFHCLQLFTVNVFQHAFYTEKLLHWTIFRIGVVTVEGMISGTRDVSTHVHVCVYIFNLFYVYGSVHHNIFYEITNRCSYMQSILCLWFRAS